MKVGSAFMPVLLYDWTAIRTWAETRSETLAAKKCTGIVSGNQPSRIWFINRYFLLTLMTETKRYKADLRNDGCQRGWPPGKSSVHRLTVFENEVSSGYLDFRETEEREWTNYTIKSVAYINVTKEGLEMFLQYGLQASIMSNSCKTLVRKLDGKNNVGDLAAMEAEL